MTHIFPLWYDILINNTNNIDDIIITNGKTLNIKTLANCIVGEAWNFTPYYSPFYDTYCEQCCEFSAQYGYLVYRETGTFKRLKRLSGDQLIAYIKTVNERFIKHFEDNHNND